MERFIKIAFWMVTFSITISGYPTVSSARHIPKNEFDIKFMKEEVKCLSDSVFYAPENVKPECMTAALECIMKELNGTVQVECNGTSERLPSALDTLDRKIVQRQKKTEQPQNKTEQRQDITNADCACERWPQVEFSVFLERYDSLLDQVFSTENKVSAG